MYHHQIEQYGPFKKHVLTNSAGTQRLVCVPGHGNMLTELVLDGVPLLDAPSTPEELRINRWYKNTLLFPFPNRLANGSYVWKDQRYHFDINEPSTETALHGLGATKPMEVIGTRLNETDASIIVSYTHDEVDECFPFAFTFEVIYQLSEKNGFECQFLVRNESMDSIPFGMGWHPYFQISEQVDEVKLKMPSCQMVGIDQRMLPTGKLYDFDDFAEAKKVGVTVLDNCFKLKSPTQREEVQLESKKGKMTYWQDGTKFPFV
ncbi:MAG: aldose 1-epimerase, partial [Saprospiraceae bacterium]|nr:aldose 1-epimerase [Saprospiraceae bacterium]